MFKHILMPTDGSQHSERAIERGIQLAKLCGACVTGLHVVRDYAFIGAADEWMDGVSSDRFHHHEKLQAAAFLEFIQRTADAAGVPCETVVATKNHPFDAIIDTANSRACDLIVMTARSRKGLLSGITKSEATRVLHRASIPVLTFRGIMSADHPDSAATPREKEIA